MKPFVRVFLPACALVLHATVSAAASPAESAADAAAAYAQGRPTDAARAYQALADAEGVSANLYYDLGAAQLAADALGPAILSFERAHWLAPSDAGIEAALRTAREKAGVPSPEATWWLRARNVLGADGWAWALAFLLALACGLASIDLLAAARLARRARVRRAVLAATTAACVGLAVASLACVSFWAETSRAVALTPDVALRIAPFEGAESRASLSVGETVRVEERHGEFLRVRAEGGRTGWVPERTLGAVVPG